MDLAGIDEVLKTARSVRRHLDYNRPIAPKVIEECIEIAVQAPTGIEAESWRFLVITESGIKKQLADLYRKTLYAFAEDRGTELKPTHHALADRLHEMPLLILVCSLGKPITNLTSSQVAFYGSVLPAAWSLMLALRARKLGTTWTSLLSGQAESVAEILDIPENVTQTVMLPVAYTLDANLKPAKRKPPKEVTYWNRWGNKSA